MKIYSRNNADGEWTNAIPGKCLWKVAGKFYTSLTSIVSKFGGLDLNPISNEDKEYLKKTGQFKSEF